MPKKSRTREVVLGRGWLKRTVDNRGVELTRVALGLTAIQIPAWNSFPGEYSAHGTLIWRPDPPRKKG